MGISYQAILDANIRITTHLLSNTSLTNTWGNNDNNEWEPIITALMVEHLLDCGFSVEDEWLSKDIYCSVKDCIDYLDSNVHSDGSFGADFWDTCRLATIIIEHDLCNYFDYEKIKRYIIDYINDGKLTVNNKDMSHATDWSGPGTYAVCAQYLFNSGEKDLAKKVITEAIDLQHNDGSFTGKKSLTGDNVIHPVWHTAQMYQTMLKMGVGNNDQLNSIISWIESVMEADGGYGILPGYSAYYTSYAAMAFQNSPVRRNYPREKTYQYLLEHELNSEIESDGGSVMALLAFDLFLGKDQISTIRERIELDNLKKLRLANNQLINQVNELKNTIKSLSQTVDSYEKKYKDADIILSKRDGFWISIIITLIGIIFPVIVNLIIEFIATV